MRIRTGIELPHSIWSPRRDSHRWDPGGQSWNTQRAFPRSVPASRWRLRWSLSSSGPVSPTGAYALIDNGGEVADTSRVIVVEQPGPNAADIPGKNEAGTAAAISPSNAATIPGKNESATAAAISPQTGAEVQGVNEAATAAAISQSGSVELRGSKASASGTSDEEAASALRTDPHGPANSLRNP